MIAATTTLDKTPCLEENQTFGWYGLGSASKDVSEEGDEIIDALIEHYGARLERLDQNSKEIMRASLSLYLCWQWQRLMARAEMPENLIQDAIDAVDADFWEIGPDACYHTEAIASLDRGRIESVLAAVNAQFRHEQGRREG